MKPSEIQIRELKASVQLKIGSNQLKLFKGDVTTLKADALVCPVNRQLETKSGVAKVILQAAGPQVRSYKPPFPEPYGKVIVLPGGQLNTKYIFLTVLLGETLWPKMKYSIKQAVVRTIMYAEFLRLSSIAFPVLGSPDIQPAYGPIAKEMMARVAEHFQNRKSNLKGIFFSIYNDEAFEAFRKQARNLANK